MTERLTIDQWLDAALEVMTDLATSTLASTGVQVAGHPRGVPAGSAGAYVALHADADPLHVGLLSTESGRQAMTRALLGMEPDEAPSEDDVVDAIGEIVNILAGGLQRRVADRVPDVALGLPIVIRGGACVSNKHELAVATIELDDVTAELVVLRQGSEDSR